MPRCRVGEPPPGEGLDRCPSSPNCVSSQSGDIAHRIAPFSYTGELTDAIGRLRGLIDSMPRTRIVACSDRYLHAEFTSRLLRFVDDVEFLADPEAGVVQARSASRVGYSDLGANRARIESLREAFEAG